MYPKGPISIYGHDEIDDINKKHEGVDVTHRTVIRVDNVIEELSYGEINVKSSVKKERETSHFSLLLYTALPKMNIYLSKFRPLGLITTT